MANQLLVKATANNSSKAVEFKHPTLNTWHLGTLQTSGADTGKYTTTLVNVPAATYAAGTLKCRLVGTTTEYAYNSGAVTVLENGANQATLTPTTTSFSYSAPSLGAGYPEVMALSVLTVKVTGAGAAVPVTFTLSGTPTGIDALNGVSVDFDGQFLGIAKGGDTLTLPAFSGTKTLVINNGHAIGTGAANATGQRVSQLTFGGGATASLQAPVTAPETIVFLADSIFTGYGSGNPGRYAVPVQLRTPTRGTVQLGYSGLQLNELLAPARRTALLAQIKGAFTGATDKKLHFQLGINDFNNNTVTPAQAATLLAGFLDAIAADSFFSETLVYLASPTVTTNQNSANSLGFTLAQYRTALLDVATGRPLVMKIDGTQEAGTGTLVDGTHHSAAGDTQIADYLRPVYDGTFIGSKVTSATSGGYRSAILAAAPLYYNRLNADGSTQPAEIGAPISLNNTGRSGQNTGLTADGSSAGVFFDGVNDAGSVPLNLSAHNRIALEFWAYSDTQFQSNFNTLLSFGPNFTTAGSFVLAPHITEPVFGDQNFYAGVTSNGQGAVQLGNGVAEVDTAFPRPLNGWHHYGIVLTNNGLESACLDGVNMDVRGTKSTGATNTFANSLLWLGSQFGTGSFLRCIVQELAVYGSNNIPSLAQFQAHYAARDSAATAPPTGPPEGFTGIQNERLGAHDARLAYAGNWINESDPGYPDGQSKFSNDANPTVTLTPPWYGNQLIIYGIKNVQHGQVDILVDGQVAHTYSQLKSPFELHPPIVINVALGVHTYGFRKAASGAGEYIHHNSVEFKTV